MKPLAAAVALALVLASTGGAAPRPALEFAPVSCIRAGELPLLQVRVTGKGELRGYFRRMNTTDWCSVEGVNEGAMSRVVLPKFEPGDEIEYFFVLLEGRRVVARSQRIYRSVVNNECENPFARHVLRLALNCSDDPAGIPSALGAGYSIEEEWVDGEPPVQSPDRPGVTTTGGQ